MNYNKEYNILFSTKEGEEDISAKAKAFDLIAELFYDRNFGVSTKADFELLMFSIYMNTLMKKLSENKIDYKQCSDSAMAKALGVPQAKIRTLKEKKLQRYPFPIEFDWVEALSKLIVHATYNEKTGCVELNIPDRNLYLKIQDYIEGRDGFVYMTLNSKLLSVRPEYFVELAVQAETEENNRKKVVNKLRAILLDNGDTELNLNSTRLSDLIRKNKSVDIKKVLSTVASALSTGNACLSIISCIVNLIS